jgi:hypothetical protein
VVSTTRKVLLSAPASATTCFYGAWASDPGGGENSGLLIVANGNQRTNPSDPCAGGGPLPDNMKPGDAWMVEGQYLEYCYKAPGATACGDPTNITEVRATALTLIGTAPVPRAAVLTASALGDKGTANARHDGALVQVRDVLVTDTNPDLPDYHGNFVVDNELWINDQFTFSYKPATRDSVHCLTGVLYYSFRHYKVLPRSDRDIVR